MTSRRPLRAKAADIVMESGTHWDAGWDLHVPAARRRTACGAGGAVQVEQVAAFLLVRGPSRPAPRTSSDRKH
ncbi:hypothetical protein ACKI2C_01695 [Streptomyces brasiliscabiei]|uniref:hypothetical protein n=1 Tax=Streptomyces brasiliscabiei TaxID=2736302 RepID=UPI0038F60543